MKVKFDLSTDFIFVLPGDIDTPTGGYRYDRSIIEGLRLIGRSVDVVQLDGDYPFPSEDQKQRSRDALSQLPEGTCIVIDALAGSVLPEAMAACALRAPLVTLLHHPLCLECGLEEEVRHQLKVSEYDSLSHAHHVITTSEATKTFVEDLFKLTPETVSVVMPGINRGKRAKPFSSNSAVRFLSVGSLTPRKGHDLLLSALEGLKDEDWELDIVGSDTFDTDTATALFSHAQSAFTKGRIRFHTQASQNQIDELYAQADVFVLASHYEGYGIAYAEALVRGLPVICTQSVANINHTLKDVGLICETNNVHSLQSCIRQILTDEALRHNMVERSIKCETELLHWEQSVAMFDKILTKVTNDIQS